MFPLSSVLFPGMPLALRVFEDRFVALIRDVLAADVHEFGVVLIERGQEVGGGDARFGLGTIARIAEVNRGEEWLNVLARGSDRFVVDRWLADDPYPRAEIRRLPDALWSDSDAAHLAEADTVVRRGLARASARVDAGLESDEPAWNPQIKLPGEHAELAWRLAGIAPLGPLDQLDLLGSDTCAELLTRLIAHVGEREDTWTALGDDPDA